MSSKQSALQLLQEREQQLSAVSTTAHTCRQQLDELQRLVCCGCLRLAPWLAVLGPALISQGGTACSGAGTPVGGYVHAVGCVAVAAKAVVEAFLCPERTQHPLHCLGDRAVRAAACLLSCLLCMTSTSSVRLPSRTQSPSWLLSGPDSKLQRMCQRCS